MYVTEIFSYIYVPRTWGIVFNWFQIMSIIFVPGLPLLLFHHQRSGFGWHFFPHKWTRKRPENLQKSPGTRKFPVWLQVLVCNLSFIAHLPAVLPWAPWKFELSHLSLRSRKWSFLPRKYVAGSPFYLECKLGTLNVSSLPNEIRPKGRAAKFMETTTWHFMGHLL